MTNKKTSARACLIRSSRSSRHRHTEPPPSAPPCAPAPPLLQGAPRCAPAPPLLRPPCQRRSSSGPLLPVRQRSRSSGPLQAPTPLRPHASVDAPPGPAVGAAAPPTGGSPLDRAAPRVAGLQAGFPWPAPGAGRWGALAGPLAAGRRVPWPPPVPNPRPSAVRPGIHPGFHRWIHSRFPQSKILNPSSSCICYCM